VHGLRACFRFSAANETVVAFAQSCMIQIVNKTVYTCCPHLVLYVISVSPIMPLYTILDPTTRLNEIIDELAQTEPSRVNDKGLYQYEISEDTCKEIMAEVLHQVYSNVVCYDCVTNVYTQMPKIKAAVTWAKLETPEKRPAIFRAHGPVSTKPKQIQITAFARNGKLRMWHRKSDRREEMIPVPGIIIIHEDVQIEVDCLFLTIPWPVSSL
jgi:hypothetical protein